LNWTSSMHLYYTQCATITPHPFHCLHARSPGSRIGAVLSWHCINANEIVVLFLVQLFIDAPMYSTVNFQRLSHPTIPGSTESSHCIRLLVSRSVLPVTHSMMLDQPRVHSLQSILLSLGALRQFAICLSAGN